MSRATGIRAGDLKSQETYGTKFKHNKRIEAKKNKKSKS
jgi:hypothetical protein